MTQEKLNEVIASHGRWLVDKSRGDRANLRYANLCGANLRGANLCDADLRGADLCGANLRDADLRGADLRNADLCSANLRDADLRDADLRDADLRNANLRNANLCGANLRDADLPAIVLQVGPIGSRKDYVVYNASNDNIRCGCWNDYKGGTLAEFEARVEEVYPSEKKDTLTFRNQYLTVIGYFKTVRETCLKEEDK